MNEDSNSRLHRNRITRQKDGLKQGEGCCLQENPRFGLEARVGIALITRLSGASSHVFTGKQA